MCYTLYICTLPKGKPYYSENLTRCSKVIWPQSPICKIGTSTFLVMSFYVMPFINKFVLVRRGECWRNICKVYLRDKSCYKVNDVATYVVTRHSRVVAYITVKQYYQQTQERKGIFASYICLKILHYYYRTQHFSKISKSGNSQNNFLQDYNPFASNPMCTLFPERH